MSVARLVSALQFCPGGCVFGPPARRDPAPSLQSRVFNMLLALLPYKQQLASIEAVQAHVQKLALQPASYEPPGLGRGVEATLTKMGGWPVYYTAPSSGFEDCNYVMFLHGGGFINEIAPAHWRFVGEMTRKARVSCVVPIYPLAPRATAKDVVPATGELLRMLLEDAGSAKVTVVGNSAGAGLALAACQWLRDRGHRQPNQMVLISPAGDASVSRPEQIEIAKRDPIQDIPGIVEAGRLYAGALDIGHPFVSPLNGAFRCLAPMTIFAGTRDLLYPDSVDLAERARAVGVPVELHLLRDQPHNYALMPTPEGRRARALIMRMVA
ncbi:MULTISPECIES: alpha/beta hydrolase fold domain-containing protein [Bradyrhizobium]|jgi:epsilon-lactone hydrolase|uniref:Monoterpene epsilon-lactone hydrolase n=2 Tax=Bradyrhizobium ottawaense TaxID=931866 RepID=A0A2U8PDB2_9BRAD|nr:MULTISPECIES: alpha/beta hydrolase fold domain-containing protein [Bradyrhizobium]AWL95763.1 steryl acetyl hydrolase [Bradyrhizobium ottawaense]MBR1288439.1 alpha/beta hydrolase fold domain-containing protein [Bradyrhizobium ottawaense]MDA9414622.1 esterase [Bradyrhizobium sp. CCBAU 25360]MDA9482869.1 esterase [Bradyrhizobium sp. CCBAU 11445]PDT66383.1 esterase [Bradyrhizobium ottawaense]